MTTEKQNKVDTLIEKWKPLLENKKFPEIKDKTKLGHMAVLLENQDHALTEAASTNTPAIASYDNVMMDMARRAVPNFLAYDLAGFQPMSMPTGVIFAMRAHASTPGTVSNTPGVAGTPAVLGDEILFNESVTSFSGAGAHVGTNPFDGSTYTTGTAMATLTAETSVASEIGIGIEKVTVTAKTRQLRASASIELRQDLAAIHGIDADAELSRILGEELTFATNRELVRTIYTIAKPGSQNTTTPGTYDLTGDADGRWLGERAKALWFHIQREANLVGIQTRRGKGNLVVCDVNTAALLGMSGIMTYAPGMQSMASFATVDVTGPTLVGTVADMKIYVDPYVTGTGAVVGYRGSNNMDAGLFYAPYVTATLFTATDPVTFAPTLGIKSRYAVVGNPFANSGILTANTNPYFRKFQITGL